MTIEEQELPYPCWAHRVAPPCPASYPPWSSEKCQHISPGIGRTHKHCSLSSSLGGHVFRIDDDRLPYVDGLSKEIFRMANVQLPRQIFSLANDQLPRQVFRIANDQLPRQIFRIANDQLSRQIFRIPIISFPDGSSGYQ